MSCCRIFATALLLLLGACGFQPLYGHRDNIHVTDEFAAIQIVRIEDRAGQELRNHLLKTMQPRGRLANTRYRLEIEVTEGRTSLGVRKSAFATRGALRVNAAVRFISNETGGNVLTFNSVVSSSFNIFQSEFATLMAEKDARTKAIKEIGEDIRVRIGAYLNTPTKLKSS